MLTPRARFSSLPLRPHAQALVPRRVFVKDHGPIRESRVEVRRPGRRYDDAQTLSRIMKMDDEDFAEKYVTMKAVLRPIVRNGR